MVFPHLCKQLFLGKSNPSALLLSWHLQGAFEVVFQEDAKPNQRVRKKKHGQLQSMRVTEKGRVENKTDQVLMMLTTTTQDDGDAPFALQVAKLNWLELRHDLLVDLKKGLQKQPTLVQLASKLCSIVVSST